MSLYQKLFGPKGDHTNDEPKVIQDRLNEGIAIMLDVRGQDERDAGHLQNSVFIQITELRQLPRDTESVDGLDKSKIIYCHCKAGVRSLIAADILKPLGYDARALKEGFEELVALGFKPASEFVSEQGSEPQRRSEPA